MIGFVSATCFGLAVLFGLFVGSFRAGLVIGIFAGVIISFALVFLDVGRENADIYRGK